jgi:hypothetical protein
MPSAGHWRSQPGVIGTHSFAAMRAWLPLLEGEGWSDEFMVNHVSVREAWGVLFAVASRAHLAILPVGCATVATSAADRAELPPKLMADAVVLRSGAELLASTEASEVTVSRETPVANPTTRQYTPSRDR